MLFGNLGVANLDSKMMFNGNDHFEDIDGIKFESPFSEGSLGGDRVRREMMQVDRVDDDAGHILHGDFIGRARARVGFERSRRAR